MYVDSEKEFIKFSFDDYLFARSLKLDTIGNFIIPILATLIVEFIIESWVTIVTVLLVDYLHSKSEIKKVNS